jgi:hypothetical protein
VERRSPRCGAAPRSSIAAFGAVHGMNVNLDVAEVFQVCRIVA